ncbi:hypothetical protein [Mesorhizobium sp.]|uniref:hypothetical protein n=2 Tax=Mesorhizobium sp. TaxID=1871066 RepID=UPI0025E1E5B3|nr:hypothetical protein [Mesorhizobium sp.]
MAMGTDILECSFNGLLAMAFISAGGTLGLLVLLLAIAALGRFVLTRARPTTRAPHDRR